MHLNALSISDVIIVNEEENKLDIEFHVIALKHALITLYLKPSFINNFNSFTWEAFF